MKLALTSLACCSLALFGGNFQSSVAVDATASKVITDRAIVLADLRKYPQTTIEVEDKGIKVKYSGVPLRVLLAEMLPDCKIDSMPEWKALTKRELVLELKGNDGFPSLVTATEVAINKSGDRFLIAVEKDGMPLDVAPQLICKMDEAKTRCVRDIVSLKIVSLH
jgi:hypothetical protein